MGPRGRAFYKKRVGMSPRRARETGGRKVKLPSEQRGGSLSSLILSSGAALARLSGKLGHIIFVAPGVGQSSSLPAGKGWSGVSDTLGPG